MNFNKIHIGTNNGSKKIKAVTEKNISRILFIYIFSSKFFPVSRLVKSGNFMVSQSNIGDDIILRPVIANPSVSKETIDEFVDEITSIGNDIIRNIPFSS